MKKVYDCFIFNNELNMLNLRLHELNNVVDFFVLVEATTTHSNKPKKLYFNENKHKFEKFSSKIIHVIVDDLPRVDDRWKIENFNRNCIMRGLINNCNDEDLVLFSDCDEIPKAEIVTELKKIDYLNMTTLRQKYYYWDFNKICGCYKPDRFVPCPWPGTVAICWRILKTTLPQKFRNIRWNNKLNNLYKKDGWHGWHLSYFGDRDLIINKILSFCETNWRKNLTDQQLIDKYSEEMLNNLKNSNKSILKSMDNNKMDLFTSDVETDPDLPKFYKIFYEKL